MDTSALRFETDQRTRLEKFDVIKPVASMLTSTQAEAQQCSLRCLMNLFKGSNFVDPLHLSGPLVSFVVPRLAGCLHGHYDLAITAARMIHTLTGITDEAASRRKLLMLSDTDDTSGASTLKALAELVLATAEPFDLQVSFLTSQRGTDFPRRLPSTVTSTIEHPLGSPSPFILPRETGFPQLPSAVTSTVDHL
jgi:hypothetical protein